MPHPSLAGRNELYCASCLLVTVRHQNLVAIVDLDRERLLWTWGPDEVEYPHEARWLENGHVLLFDNGSEARGYSRILEVDPATGRIVWDYRAPRPRDFLSESRGTVQALGNGNVLIASSNQGVVFETSRSGELVWRYVYRGDDGKLEAIRAARYPHARVEPFLARALPGDRPR